jgi:GH25 family lysozyme M1 (1,4-beta-N-acetylmuramidase)
MTNLVPGLDVSNIQMNINWQSVAEAGYKFMIARAGIGNDGIDNLFKQNVANASAAGICTSAYNVIYPLPTIASQPLRDPTAQAQYHFEAVGGSVSVVSIDLEFPLPQNWSQWGCSASQIIDWTTTYMEAYTKLSGITCLIYSYPSFLSSVNFPPSFCEAYKLWLASYTNSPVSVSGWGSNHVLWQASGGAINLPGTSTPVDLDYAYDLSLWNVQTAQTPSSSVPVVNTMPATDNTTQPTITVPAATTPPSTVSTSGIVSSTVASGTVQPAGATSAANPNPGSSSVIQDIENLSQPGILSAIGTFISNLLKLLFSIK